MRSHVPLDCCPEPVLPMVSVGGCVTVVDSWVLLKLVEDEDDWESVVDSSVWLKLVEDSVLSELSDDVVLSELSDDVVLSELSEDVVLSELSDDVVLSELSDDVVLSELSEDVVLSEPIEDVVLSEPLEELLDPPQWWLMLKSPRGPPQWWPQNHESLPAATVPDTARTSAPAPISAPNFLRAFIDLPSSSAIPGYGPDR